MMHWRLHQSIFVPDELRSFVGGHPLVAERLARAGLTGIDSARAFLDPGFYQASSPFELPGVDIAVERLNRAIKHGEMILIWGDFDVDGQTATTLLYTGLRGLGANVVYHVPLRDGQGHGMHLPKLREWLARGARVIVTCDTGITAHEAVDVAQAAGVDVLITDHHLLGDTLPNALAVINPMRLPPEHALREMPGVGVAYELIRALTDGRNCDELLDLVALGIVADVAEQKKETRYLLQRGIAMTRLSTRPGLRALLDLAQINPLEMDESDIAFGLGPRLNAQGRLGNAADSVELLSTLDAARAAELASQLEGMNARRKLESRFVEESAESLLERDPSLLEYAAIVLAHPEWSGGVVGIVANRLADKYHKPVALLCEQDDIAFGSARSVPGCNITDALRACRAMLLKFGGHAMAAGMTLRRNDIYDFRRLLSQTVRELVTVSGEEPELAIDGYLRLDEITHELAADLRRLAPFGNGNPPLTLASTDLRLVRKKKLGRKGDHLEMVVEGPTGAQQRVLWWNADSSQLPKSRFDLAYNLRINRYKDRADLVLELIDLQARDGDEVEVQTEQVSYEIEDHRNETDKSGKLAELITLHPDAIVWREDAPAINGRNRTELKAAETLIVWTIPPGPAEWNAALEKVKPRRIIVFGQTSGIQTIESFLQRLGGLLKYAINAKGGETSLSALAAATAQRTDAVRYGLNWFNHNGQLIAEARPDDSVIVVRGQMPQDQFDQASLEKLLKSVLAETIAYRKNWIL